MERCLSDMPERYIQSFACRFLDPANEAESLAALSSGLPRRAARRMSTLGILMHSVLENQLPDLETAVVYGTCFTESNALETFLDSLPHASPTAFQTSIHPGGVEQALIMRKQAVGAFFPFAGDDGLMLQLLKSTFTSAQPATLVCGGEERGSWLRQFGVAYPRSFAFSFFVTRDPGKPIGSITWKPGYTGSGIRELSMEETVRSMESGQPVTMGSPDHGLFKISLE